MIKKLTSEVWKTMKFSGSTALRNRYALSTHGRIASYKDDILADGKLLNGSITTGYRTLNLHRPGNKGTLYIHREMAKLFLPKSSPKHKYVIHKNHNKLDNNIKNLKWATLTEMIEHQQFSPAKMAYKEKQANTQVGLKLTAPQVKKIKEILNKPRRKLTIKQLAEKYDVSEMTMYRIKSGENWGRV
ncbi:HNH endonuclease [Chitinophagaceae bacterium LB-8]|uniref:HNH endonuclease n=1 Tax=Paraflavisolibacter caeni TaxID=2982496 RepID=A0A9X2XPZ7_9BACT|nr:HNH endonuclease [Paraflavisolibacter caeni]MCU7552598.1 HNH endonuclease [Paraflavisolibacter caeni]